MHEPAYPALYDPASKKLHSLRGTPSFVVGRSETADLTVLDVGCSRQQFRIVRLEGRHFVEPLSSTSPTYRNGQPIGQRTPLTHDDHLDAGTCRFVFYAEAPVAKGQQSILAAATIARAGPLAAEASAASATEALMTVRADSHGSVPLPPIPAEALRPIPVSGKMLIGRDQGRVQIHLDHPHVSRVHAHLTLENDQLLLFDLNSANGTYVNGQRIRESTVVRPGDQIDVGPYALLFKGQTLVPRSRFDNVELVAHNVRRTVTSRETGMPLTLLDDITLVIRPREFVCLLGPSGSGKSTLLSALSGRMVLDGGHVQVNGQDLHARFDALKHDMAVVPQNDVLHSSLTVGDALWYTGRLRLPPDLSAGEVQTCIDETLETVRLKDRRGVLIRHLSGGQVKRASLANEIMCKPSLLFLDEVTSGLDEQTDRDLMDLFRSLADTGKTVVCITHSLTNVERACHLVVILAGGGRLAFVGKPAEALEYFGIERLGDVYERLAEQPAEYWQNSFKTSPFFQSYVATRLPKREEAPLPPIRQQRHEGKQLGRLFLRQAALLTQRYFAIWRGDWPALLAMAGQSLLVAVLLGLLFGNLNALAEPERAIRSASLLFLLAVTSFWFGCNNAAKEIVKERIICTRERDFNIRIGTYYCSKFLLLVVFSAIQTLVLAFVVRVWCGPPGNSVMQCLLLLSLATAGVALGLVVSALARSEEMAVTMIPVAVIPQIVLSSAIAPVGGLSKFLAQMFVTAYWGNRGLDALLPESLAQLAGLPESSTWASLLIICLHVFVFVFAALAVLFWQGRRARGLGLWLRAAKMAIPVSDGKKGP